MSVRSFDVIVSINNRGPIVPIVVSRDTQVNCSIFASSRLLSQNSSNFKSIESHLKKDIENLLKVIRKSDQIVARLKDNFNCTGK